MKPSPIRRRHAEQVRTALTILYPETRTALNYRNPLELLVSVILSAQCTDVRVNLVTPELFRRFPTVEAFASANLRELQNYIRSTGFFRNKARNIRACCRLLLERHDGVVPASQDALVDLPGIGRKTANVILGDAFGIPGITVDTHVGRLSRRLGLTKHTNPVKVEFELMALVPQAEWTTFSHRLIYHGRQVCHSRKPDCGACSMAGFCPKIGVKRPVSSESAPEPTQQS